VIGFVAIDAIGVAGLMLFPDCCVKFCELQGDEQVGRLKPEEQRRNTTPGNNPPSHVSLSHNTAVSRFNILQHDRL
jgi:hypothetical protein